MLQSQEIMRLLLIESTVSTAKRNLRIKTVPFITMIRVLMLSISALSLYCIAQMVYAFFFSLSQTR